jgi:hypothetical protein
MNLHLTQPSQLRQNRIGGFERKIFEDFTEAASASSTLINLVAIRIRSVRGASAATWVTMPNDR